MPNQQPGRDAPETAYVSHVGDCRTCRRESGRCPQGARLWRFYQEWRNNYRARPEDTE
ncbi:hypothetical protein ACFCYX_16280 [Streptomyces populi]|uniref:hypothetical protein n=1 Tax=Streptomyces populi TaxID=2058924 RepID=UPI0013A6EC00|nr:hypothetical protein [Streptomyces populi]